MFQQKLERATSEHQKTLDELANAYKINADQEKEFRLNLTGGNNMPQLNILMIKRTDIEKVGNFVQMNMDIENDGQYPIHNLSIEINDIDGFNLYNSIRITRNSGLYAADTNPKHVEFEDYPRTYQTTLQSLPKMSKQIPIYTRCYKLNNENKNLSFTVKLVWNMGTITYYANFNFQDGYPEFAKETQVVVNGALHKKFYEKYLKISLLNFKSETSN